MACVPPGYTYGGVELPDAPLGKLGGHGAAAAGPLVRFRLAH
jgi:hypothetical protein